MLQCSYNIVYTITEKCDQFNEETINKFIMLFFPFYISGSIYKIGNLFSHNWPTVIIILTLIIPTVHSI